MSLTTRDVENIAHLARLTLTPAELPVYADSLARILDMAEQLKAADISRVEAMAHPLADQVQRLRADEVNDADQHDKYQRNAPAAESGLYLVPKVID